MFILSELPAGNWGRGGRGPYPPPPLPLALKEEHRPDVWNAWNVAMSIIRAGITDCGGWEGGELQCMKRPAGKVFTSSMSAIGIPPTVKLIFSFILTRRETAASVTWMKNRESNYGNCLKEEILRCDAASGIGKLWRLRKPVPTSEKLFQKVVNLLYLLSDIFKVACTKITIIKMFYFYKLDSSIS